MFTTEVLTDAQWEIADAVAHQLVIEGTDVNELRKAMAYLRDRQGQEDAGGKFFDYLQTLVRNGNSIGHSKRTLKYYKSLDSICSQYLADYKDDGHRLLHILSWSARLVQYYENGVPTGEIERPNGMSEREAEIQAFSQSNSFSIGQKIEAVVTSIRGKRVTYEILETIKLTQKEPKKAKDISVGQTVSVEIIQLRNGSPNKVKSL